MWELAAGAGHYMIGLAGFSAQTGRYQNTERTRAREHRRRGGHLMVQSLNTLINSIHFAPRRQGFVSIHEAFVRQSPPSAKTYLGYSIFKKIVMFLRGLLCLDDNCDIMMFPPGPRPLPPASNCFVLGTIRWLSYK